MQEGGCRGRDRGARGGHHEVVLGARALEEPASRAPRDRYPPRDRFRVPRDDVRAEAEAGPRGLPQRRDLIVEILARLPERPLRRSKCVCRSWRDLISGPVHRRRLAHTDAASGFFYHANADGSWAPVTDLKFTGLCRPPVEGGVSPTPPSLDQEFAFQPPSYTRTHVELLDSCNGLLLLRYYDASDELAAAVYIVCNPSTQDYVELPPPPPEPSHVPDVIGVVVPSPLQPLIICSSSSKREDRGSPGLPLWPSTRPSPLTSTSSSWRRKGAQCSLSIAPSSRRCRSTRRRRGGGLPGEAGGTTTSRTPASTPTSTASCTVPRHHRHRERRGGGGGHRGPDVDGHPRVPGGPGETWLPRVIGQSQRRLLYADAGSGHARELSVYALEDCGGGAGRWVLKHRTRSLDPSGKVRFGKQHRLVAIHPDCNVVFLFDSRRRSLIAYDMDRGTTRVVHTFTVATGKHHFFPYIPLYLQ
nr:uncharacterized protein LOC117856030 [Setaria viridis]